MQTFEGKATFHRFSKRILDLTVYKFLITRINMLMTRHTINIFTLYDQDNSFDLHRINHFTSHTSCRIPTLGWNEVMIR